MGHIAFFCATLLAVVFAVSSVGKILDFAAFVDSLKTISKVSEPLSNLLGAAILAAEVLTVLALATVWTDATHWAAYGFATATTLSIVFAVVVSAEVRKGSRAQCLCFGRKGTRFGARHVVRNGCLALAGVAGLISMSSAPLIPLAGMILAAGTGLFAAVVCVTMDDVVELFRSGAGGVSGIESETVR
ncbi:MauE/DoxX family redox-associated membrane protein [Streptosporangium sp. NPDC023615]|uniref:MauE/DoxX family redox-associated membrane protein n=1 Tax=Streptosporangium sp. NPDC023615 TaxID=3154794 RepID=UPI0034377430